MPTVSECIWRRTECSRFFFLWLTQVLQYVERTIVAKEGIGVSTANAGRNMWRFINANASLSQFGTTPGYAIVPVGTTSQDLPDDHPMVQSTAFSKSVVSHLVSFSTHLACIRQRASRARAALVVVAVIDGSVCGLHGRYNIAVTKRKEAEQRVTSVYDLYGQMSPPIISLDDYLTDGDSLMDEDLVAWVRFCTASFILCVCHRPSLVPSMVCGRIGSDELTTSSDVFVWWA